MKNKLAIAVCALALGAGPLFSNRPARIAPRTALETRGTALTDSVVSAYLTVNPGCLDRDALSALGATVAVEAGNLMTVRFPLSAINALASVEGVEYIQTAGAAHGMLDIAREETGAARVQQGDGLPQGYEGAGVIVGVVDRGFDYGHSAFRNADGSLRIKRVWEQATKEGTAPSKFGYGAEFTSEADILAAGGDIRNNSHGTHVAAIAAGSGRLPGMAPKADIVLVSLGNDEDATVNITNAISYIFDYAGEEGKPCVVNLSLGAHDGPHDGTSPFDLMADELQGPGRLIVGSAGNHRGNKFHVEGSSYPLRTFIDFRKTVSALNNGGDISVWSAPGQEITVNLLVCNTNSGEVAERVEVYPAEVSEASLGRNVSGSVAVSAERNPQNNKIHVALTSAITAIRNNHAVAIEVTSPTAGKTDIWADNVKVGLTSRDMEGYSDGTAPTIAEIGGTAKRILTVGSYTTRAEYSVLGVDGVQKLDETVGALSSFSSCGPTADGRMKPAVCAPGCYISSAVSSHDASGTIKPYMTFDEYGRTMIYGYMQGTSMSSPLVAGVVATWLEAYPGLTPEELAEVIGKTARTDSFTGDLPEGDNDWGHGKIDAYAGLKECVTLAANVGIYKPEASDEAKFHLSGRRLHVLSASASPVTICNTLGMRVCGSAAATETAIDLSGLPAGLYVARSGAASFSFMLR